MQIKTILKKVLVFLRSIALVDLVISLLVAFSFVLTGNFSFVAYSERLFWTGLAVTILAAMVALASMFSGSSFGIPAIIRRPEEAKRFLARFGDMRAEVEKRQNLSIQMFFIGLGCIGVSALVQTFLG
jgi:hypothetical protein